MIKEAMAGGKLFLCPKAIAPASPVVAKPLDEIEVMDWPH